MIYAYIFVMAGVTYLIRMLPDIDTEKNYKCLFSFFFILYSLCLSYRYDISGNSLCNPVSCLRNCRAHDRSGFGT